MRGWPLRFAAGLFSVVSLGLPGGERQRILDERCADVEAQAVDPVHNSAVSIGLRAIRSVPSDLWARVGGRNLSTVPTSSALVVIAVGASVLSLAGAADSVHSAANSATAFGLSVVAFGLLRRLRLLDLVAIRWGTGLVAIGAGIAAVHLAVDGPSHGFDLAIRGALGLASVGCAGITLTGFRTRSTRRQLHVAGGVLCGGGVGCSPLSLLTRTYATLNPAESVAAFVVGAGALAAANLVLRLRGLPLCRPAGHSRSGED